MKPERIIYTPKLPAHAGRPNEQNAFTKEGLNKLVKAIQHRTQLDCKRDQLARENGFKTFAALHAAWRALLP